MAVMRRRGGSRVTEGTDDCFEVSRGRPATPPEDPRIGSQQDRDVANHSFRIQRIDPFLPSALREPCMRLGNERQ